VFGNQFDHTYIMQRHAELLQAAERERLACCLLQARRAERIRSPWGKRMLAATGQQLVAAGTRLQQAATQ
jgi:hypothetical protein